MIDFRRGTTHLEIAMKPRPFLIPTLLIAGLFALATVSVPAKHTGVVFERAAFALAYAMPDGTLPETCLRAGESHDGHDRHQMAPTCLACVVMAAPGLAAPASPVLIRAATLERITLPADHEIRAASASWCPQHARAPPLLLLA